MRWKVRENAPLVEDALREAGREDLLPRFRELARPAWKREEAKARAWREKQAKKRGAAKQGRGAGEEGGADERLALDTCG